MRKYDLYKETNIEWIGDIPRHWKTATLDRVSTIKARLGWKGLKASEYVDDGYIFLSTPNIKGNEIDFENVNYITEERYLESPEIMLQRGDVLIAKDGSTLGITSVVRMLPRPATVNSSIAVIRPNEKIDSVYLYYFLASDYTQNIVQRVKDGMGVPHLFQADLRKFKVIMPDIDEQKSIARYLDHKTTQIDDLIARKQRLIELLQEQRTALINRAVTKGLNPDAPMKDSGIEWLGEVPVHWKIGQLRYASESIQTGPFGSQLHSEEYIDDGIPVINPSNLGNGKIIANWSITVDESVFQRLTRHRLDVGDIVFGRRGEMGRCALVTEKEDGWLCGTGCLRLRLDTEKVFPPFIAIYLSTIRIKEWLELQSVGSTMSNLNTEILSRIPIPLLSVDEQQKIVDAINISESQISTIIDKESKLIELLRSFRTSLISEAVTGKIDVRDEVPA